MKETISLSDGEWKLMNLLWEDSPRTVAQLVRAMAHDTGWTKATIFIMLGRMAEKGAVIVREGARAKQYYAAVPRDEIAAAGIHPLAASASVGFLSVLSIRLGNWLGLHAAALPVRPAALQRLGGLMMVGLGLLQLCT